MFHQYRNLVEFLVIRNDVVGPELDVQSGVVVLIVKNSEKDSVVNVVVAFDLVELLSVGDLQSRMMMLVWSFCLLTREFSKAMVMGLRYGDSSLVGFKA